MTGAIKSILASRRRGDLLVMAIALAITVAVSAAAIGWAMSTRSAATGEHEAQLAASAAGNAAAADFEAASADLPARTRDSLALRAAGFATAADRVSWVETTIVLLGKLRPLGYTVEVEPARAFPVPDSLQAWYVERGLEPPVFEVNDLSLNVQGLVETELLQVLEVATAAGGAVVRTEYCKLTRRADDAGIDAQCRLRRFSLPQTVKAPPT